MYTHIMKFVELRRRRTFACNLGSFGAADVSFDTMLNQVKHFNNPVYRFAPNPTLLLIPKPPVF